MTLIQIQRQNEIEYKGIRTIATQNLTVTFKELVMYYYNQKKGKKP